jgi:hypothetical protein
MSLSLRLQCGVIAVAVLPCLAMAQSSLLGNAAADAPEAAYQASAAPAQIAVDAVPSQGHAVAVELTAIPAPNLETEPIPTQTAEPPADATPAEGQIAATSGPSLSSASAGLQTRSTEHVTRKQLADRALQDDGGHRGLGRDAMLMVIGGAAIVAGAIVGGGGGTALIVVGAIIGATGLILVLS